jgi:hypothetical protein
MRIIPFAFDSFGIRSMATFIETNDLSMVIDPGISYAPIRFGLEVTNLELDQINKKKSELVEHVKRANFISISHYHYDHYNLPEHLYKGKTVYVKDYKHNINKSQIERSTEFIPKIEKIAHINIADNNEFSVGNTLIKYSMAVKHGSEKTKLGYVVMVLIESNGKRLIHASDIQGPIIESTRDWIIEQKPNFLILSGPPLYLYGWRFPQKDKLLAIENMKAILDISSLEVFILDHHCVRDKNFKEKMKPAYEYAKKKNKQLITATEYLGKPLTNLEAWRREITQGKYP